MLFSVFSATDQRASKTIASNAQALAVANSSIRHKYARDGSAASCASNIVHPVFEFVEIGTQKAIFLL